MGTSLRAEGLVKSFGGERVLDGWDLEVGGGERLVILGPSGCGKTTFLRIIAGLLEKDDGEIHGDLRNVGFVFQNPRLIPWKTVLENLLFVREDRETALGVLEMVGLSGYEDRFPRELSGGMKQRVNLARALMVEPSLLLLDEPFSSLDLPLKMKLMEDLNELWRKLRFSMITVTHDPREAVSLGDRIAISSPKPSRIVAVLDGIVGEEEVVESLVRFSEIPG